MKREGTFEEVLGKVYDYYMERNVGEKWIYHFLSQMKEKNGRRTFGSKQIRKLIETLRRDKEEK